MSIYNKLFEAKKEIGKISKDSKNPFFKCKYFDINSLLEHVEPILQKHQLLILQPINDGFVSTQIIDIENGELITSALELKNQTDPQKRGSEITYYRRYTLVSLLGLQAEDDDGNLASKPTPKKLPKLIKDSKEWNGALAKKSAIEKLKQYFDITIEDEKIYCEFLNK